MLVPRDQIESQTTVSRVPNHPETVVPLLLFCPFLMRRQACRVRVLACSDTRAGPTELRSSVYSSQSLDQLVKREANTRLPIAPSFPKIAPRAGDPEVRH